MKESKRREIKKGDTVLVNYDGKEMQSKVTWVGKYQKIGGYHELEKWFEMNSFDEEF